MARTNTIVGIVGIGVTLTSIAFAIWQMRQAQIAEAELLEVQRENTRALEEAQSWAGDLGLLLEEAIRRIESGELDVTDIAVDTFENQVNNLLAEVYSTKEVPLEDQFTLITDGFRLEDGAGAVLAAPDGSQRAFGVENLNPNGNGALVNFGDQRYSLDPGQEVPWSLPSTTCYVGYLGRVDTGSGVETAQFFLRCD